MSEENLEKKIQDYIDKNVKISSKIRVLRVCPRCLSTNVVPLSSISGWLVQDTYLCKNCGYRGFMIEMSKDELDAIKSNQ